MRSPLLVVIAAALGAILAPPTAAAQGGDEVVMVVSDPSAPTSGDAAVQSRLAANGFTVQLVDDDAAIAADAAGAEFVLISSSTSSSAVGATFGAVDEPVWVAKPWLLDDMAMTGPGGGANFGLLSSDTVTVLDPTHPLAAGTTGDVLVSTTPRSMSHGVPASAADVVTSAGGQPSTFVYPVGAELADGSTAAGCRLHSSLFKSAPQSFTAAGWALFDAAAAYAAGGCAGVVDPPAGPFVVIISIDGLKAETIPALGPTELANLHRFIDEGATTANARNVRDQSRTLPNHTSMLTGLPVLGPNGHGVTFNDDNGATVHDSAGRYIPSVFDVARDAGLTTALYASKTKFEFLGRSWVDEIDTYERNGDATTVAEFSATMVAAPFNLSLLHLAGPDAAGHNFGWESAEYEAAVRMADGYVGQILDLIEADPTLTADTHVILTSDHGGTGTQHSDPDVLLNVQIPFFVWGPTVAAGIDLYAINTGTRLDPSSQIPDHAAVPQPIRNADAANLALDLLALGPVPGSSINGAQDLAIDGTVPTSTVVFVVSDPIGLSASDAAVRDRLVGAGFAVTTVDDDAATAGDATNAVFVLVSSSASSGAVGDTFRDVASPVWVAKPWLLDDLDLTGQTASVDYGTVSASTVTVASPGHPLAAGRSGDVTVTPTPKRMSYGLPGGDAVVATTVDGTPTTFVYQPGALLADGSTAAGCRLHASAFKTAVFSWNADAWALFDAAAQYAAQGCP